MITLQHLKIHKQINYRKSINLIVSNLKHKYQSLLFNCIIN